MMKYFPLDEIKYVEKQKKYSIFSTLEKKTYSPVSLFYIFFLHFESNMIMIMIVIMIFIIYLFI